MRSAVVFLIAGWSLLDTGRAAEPAARPNVLFVVCDDLNTHVSTSGYPYIKTPSFDELASAGMTFDRAYCQYPVCGPSRASFLSGLYPESTGVLDNKADVRQLPERSGPRCLLPRLAAREGSTGFFPTTRWRRCGGVNGRASSGWWRTPGACCFPPAPRAESFNWTLP